MNTRARKQSYTGCMVIGLLCVSFLVGGIIGGIFGGGMVLWAIDPSPIAQLSPTPSATATTTPQPAATLQPVVTPTATRVIVPTPSVEDVIEQILPSVVTIINTQIPDNTTSAKSPNRMVGSGVIIDSRGYILTNAHVVSQNQQLKVLLANGTELPAGLVMYESAQDLALIKVEAENLTPASWGDSNQVRLGQPVIAIGSALGDFPNSVTMGIVSGLNRALLLDQTVLYGLIQTDAAINQGNSGGPLITLQGKVIGINTFIIREDHAQGVAEGIGFAIPATSATILAEAWITQNIPSVQAGNSITETTYPPHPLPAAQPTGN